MKRARTYGFLFTAILYWLINIQPVTASGPPLPLVEFQVPPVPLGGDIEHHLGRNLQEISKNRSEPNLKGWQKRLQQLKHETSVRRYHDFKPLLEEADKKYQGRGIKVAVVSGGIKPETVAALGERLFGYFVLAPDFSVHREEPARQIPHVSYQQWDDAVFRLSEDRGDNAIRHLLLLAPKAQIMAVNNYNSERESSLGGHDFKSHAPHLPRAISRTLDFLSGLPAQKRPRVLVIPQGVEPWRNIPDQELQEMVAALKRAHQAGILVIMPGGEISRRKGDGKQLGLNQGLNHPYVLVSGSLIDWGLGRPEGRNDHSGNKRVLFLPASTSAAAAARLGGLVCLLLEKSPGLDPDAIIRLLFTNTSYRVQFDGQHVYELHFRAALQAAQ